ncbi:hypothetical protein, partial [Stutzerimonas nosocomialis]|uniref:hypothetical protein n=1 Tax=Stutzerimonas nosocomialis TaxID=1056496 RepID=UPI0019D67F74
MLIKGLLVQEWLEGGAKPEGGVLVGGGLARFHVSIGSVEKLHEVVDSDSGRCMIRLPLTRSLRSK